MRTHSIPSKSLCLLAVAALFLATSGCSGSSSSKGGGGGGVTAVVKSGKRSSSEATPTPTAAATAIATATATATPTATPVGMLGSAQMLKDINASTTTNDVAYGKNFLALANGNVVFVAMNLAHGEEVWVTNGTAAGTFALDSINPNISSFPATPAINLARTQIAFICASENGGSGICVSDGSLSGTRRITGEVFGAINNMRVCGSRIFGTATFGANGTSLITSDGTSALTLAKSYTDIGATTLSNVACAGSRLFFTTNSSSTGAELWMSDGSSGGTALVKDIYSGTSAGVTGILGAVGNKVVFVGKEASYTGADLWMYDPDASDCSAFDQTAIATCSAPTNGSGRIGILKDVYTGGTNGANAGVSSTTGVVMNGKVYFQGTDATSNSELWYTDGTNGGTLKVYDFAETGFAPTLSSAGVYEAGASSRLYFVGTRSGTYGKEPHMLALNAGSGCASYGSDFVAATNGGGCIGMISDMYSGTTNSTTTYYGANASGVFFKSVDTSTAYYYWNNTTTAPIAFTTTIPPDSGASAIAGGLLYSTNSTTTGVVGGSRELWLIANGSTTPALVKEINNEAGSINPSNSTGSANAERGLKRYFAAWDETHGAELWVTDGTTSGTRLVKDIYSETSSSSVNSIVVMNDVVYFRATDGVSGVELWAYDPAATDCSRFDPSTTYTSSCDTADAVNVPGKIGVVKDIYSTSDSTPSNMKVIGSKLYFTALNAANSYDPWVSDGTYLGTKVIYNFPAGGSTLVSGFAAVGSAVVFQAPTTATEGDLYAFIPGSQADDAACVASHGAGYLRANAEGCYARIYNFTATAPGITILGSTNDGTKVFFQAAEAASGSELWVTNGTSGGTALVKDIFPGASGSTSVYQGGTAGAFGTDKFVFTAVDSYTANGIANQQIWISDGSAAGTYALSASETGYLARALVVDSANNKIFFFAGTAAAGTELWTSDGTIAGTGMVDDFCPGTCVGAASGVDLKVTLGITLLGDGRVIFRGNDGSSGSEPVVSDGTASGTYLVDMVSGTAGSMPTLFLPIVSGVTLTKVLIFATDGTTGLEPWVIQP